MATTDQVINELDRMLEVESSKYIEAIKTPTADPIALLTLRAAYKSGMVRAFTIMAKRGKADA